MKKRLKWLIPLSAVAIVAVVAAVALIPRTPDQIVYEPGTVIYQDDQVTAKVVEPAAQRQIIYSMYGKLTEEEIFVDHHIIATGTVKNIREVEISYTDLGGPTTIVVTLFDFYVHEYIKNDTSNLRSQAMLTVGWSNSSYRWSDDAPVLEDGADYLLFMEALSELKTEGLMGRIHYSDAWVLAPELLAYKKQNNSYTVKSYLSEYFSEEQWAVRDTKLLEIIAERVDEIMEVN